MPMLMDWSHNWWFIDHHLIRRKSFFMWKTHTALNSKFPLLQVSRRENVNSNSLIAFQIGLTSKFVMHFKIDLREVTISYDNDWQKKKLIESFSIEFLTNNMYFVWGINISCLTKNPWCLHWFIGMCFVFQFATL